MERPELDYDAICLDTCILDSQGIAFERGLLKQLEQFASSPVQLVVPDIVHNEVERHLTERLQDARTKVARAVRIAASELHLMDGDLRTVERILSADGGRSASQHLAEFYKRTDAYILRSAQIDVGKLVDLYFATRPPFESSGNKKAEFPDAIALLSLEAWAATNNAYVLVVSADDGWRQFCETSDRLDFATNLAEALEHFQPHNVATALIKELKQKITAGELTGILGSITDEIAKAVGRTPVRAEASSSYYLNELDVDAAYVSHVFHRDARQEPDVKLVRISSDCIVIQLGATVQCEVTASYGMSIRDPIDRDYVEMGKTKVSTNETFEADITVTLIGDFARGLAGIDADEVEVEGSLQSVDFGHIDPDPTRDEWDREKYAAP